MINLCKIIAVITTVTGTINTAGASMFDGFSGPVDTDEGQKAIRETLDTIKPAKGCGRSLSADLTSDTENRKNPRDPKCPPNEPANNCAKSRSADPISEDEQREESKRLMRLQRKAERVQKSRQIVWLFPRMAYVQERQMEKAKGREKFKSMRARSLDGMQDGAWLDQPLGWRG
jgi:hypothetical protein